MKSPRAFCLTSAAILLLAAVAGVHAEAPPLGNNLVSSVSVATQSGDFTTPLGATPDAQGKTIYFTARNASGPGVFRVAATGGAAAVLWTGAPFVAPRGLVISPDGQWLYVADPQARQGARVGLIFRLPLGGGAPQSLAATAGTSPQSLAWGSTGDQPVLYYTGIEAHSGQPAVLALAMAADGTPRVVAAGPPLVTPDGLAVTRAGVLYVTDRQVAGASDGVVFRIGGHAITPLVRHVHLGNPAGVALSPHDALLLVSAHQPGQPGDEVLVVDLSTGRTGAVTMVVGHNRVGGGLHGPVGVPPVYAWADRTAGGRGQVYLVSVAP